MKTRRNQILADHHGTSAVDLLFMCSGEEPDIGICIFFVLNVYEGQPVVFRREPFFLGLHV